ncbi:hypothetical protein H351_15495 [Rhodococcus erythropolis R138]|uniref:HNH endonuclease n=1 Tax=Rhodococcus erythropolis TaxID=1833 RepID=UPI00068BB677|nr:HNH endonuclease signature motif containing protein [Rhodococcus erythropolis]ALU70518.1 hypothetical protein H351_15495 [Rhodococcus erythropolis R138]
MAQSNWGTGSSHRTRTPGHRNRRSAVLARDKERCQLRYEGCTGKATEADHIVNIESGGAEDIANMQAVCSTCHKHKTAQESAAARRANQKKRRHPSIDQKHPGLL